MKNSNTETNSPVLVTFWKQGGIEAQGTAIGRKGKSLLISYTIADGSPRERWIPGKRITGVVSGEVESLPRWKSATCKGTKFAEPTTEPVARTVCAECGNRHSIAYTFDYDGTGDKHHVRRAVGLSSYKLADVLA